MKKSTPLKAADATLVNAAFREAEAHVPKYSKEAVKTQAGLANIVGEGLTKAVDKFKEGREAEEKEYEDKIKKENQDKEAQGKGFEATYDVLYTKLSTMESGGQETSMHGNIYDSTYAEADRLREEFQKYNTVGDEDTIENRKKRMEIMGRLDALSNSVTGVRGTLLSVGANSKTRSKAMGGSKDQAILSLIGNQWGEGNAFDGVEEVVDENGVVTTPGRSAYVSTRYNDKSQLVFDVVLPDKFGGGLDENGNPIIESFTEDQLKGMFIPRADEERAYMIETSGGIFDKALEDEENNIPSTGDNKPQARVDDLVNKIIDSDNPDKTLADLTQSRLHGNPTSGYKVQELNAIIDNPESTPEQVEQAMADKLAAESRTTKYEKGSFADALANNPVLNVEFYERIIDPKDGRSIKEDVDIDPKDGVISQEEAEKYYMNSENRDMVIDNIVNPQAKYYNREFTANLFATARVKQDHKLYLQTRAEIAKTREEGAVKTKEELRQTFLSKYTV